MIDPRSKMLVDKKLDARWVQSFAECFCIVSRAHNGKHALSPSKQKERDRGVVRHLGYMYRLLSSEAANEGDIENADETHFVNDMDSGKTLVFADESKVK